MSLCGSSKPTSFGRRAIQRKVVVCGDGACGKTSLLNVFTRGFFTQVYEPTVFENYVHDTYVDDQLVELSLWDTAGTVQSGPHALSIPMPRFLGQEEFDRLRSLSYAETHVIMICFSVDNPTSLENVESKWLDEILEYCPGVKLVLVALKCDLRDDWPVKERLQRYGTHPVQYEEGLTVARRIRASRYLGMYDRPTIDPGLILFITHQTECSSKHNRGVTEVFYEAARVSLSTRPKGSGEGCVVM
ncbi:Rho GTPase [Marasmius sp. AFHP31]|nr:Rho GTPase [Marasmius sp. AFHP31]